MGKDSLIDKLKLAGSGLLDVIGGFGQITLGVGIATGGTAASGGILGGVAIAGGIAIGAIGVSNVSGGLAKIYDAFSPKDINEKIFDIVEYQAKKNTVTSVAYTVADVGSGLYSSGAGLKSTYNFIKNGGKVIDMSYDGFNAKKALKETINSTKNLSILGQRGKQAYVVLDKMPKVSTVFDGIGGVTGLGQVIYSTNNKSGHRR